MNSVMAAFEAAAADRPDRIAIYHQDEKITYAEVRDRAARFAAILQQTHRIEPGMRVGILLRNRPEFVYALYGILQSGAVAVPINTFLKAPEVQHIATDCALRCLITSDDFDELLGKLQGVRALKLAAFDVPDGGSSPMLSRHPHPDPLLPLRAGRERGSEDPASTARGGGRTRVVSRTGEGDAFTPTAGSISLENTAVIIYTSGTTGKSKGAVLTHGNIAANVHSCMRALEETAADRMTLLLPMFHSFMLTVCIFTPLSMGASIVLITSVQPFKLVLREMLKRRATIFIGIPQIFQALAQAKIPFWVHWFLNLRIAVSGSAPLPHDTLDKFDRKFRFPLLEGYGLSEASPVVSFNPINGVRKAGSVGLPLPDVEVKIFDEHDRELPSGQVGEIVVRGPNVMQGYFNQPEETAQALRGGWLHTGDMGKLDQDGYIYIVDRRKEMLLVRGMNVYPREIEEVLYKCAGVREAAVIPRPDEKRGEAPVAFVAAVDGVQLQERVILEHCRENLADYKVPREVRLMESLPRTATGKIAKLELKKLL